MKVSRQSTGKPQTEMKHSMKKVVMITDLSVMTLAVYLIRKGYNVRWFKWSFFSEFFNSFFFFDVDMCDIVHDIENTFYLLTANILGCQLFE